MLAGSRLALGCIVLFTLEIIVLDGFVLRTLS